MTQLTINGFGISLQEKIARAHELLKANEPADGYYVAFSGGKDSTVILDLCQRAGVKHDAWYNNTTIDQPELVRHIKKHYPYVRWQNQQRPMMALVAELVDGPPTRLHRWCCRLFKECGGEGRTKVIGVRAEESPRRAATWEEVTPHRNGRDTVICPILRWSHVDVWSYIRVNGLPYCELYDEGYERLGCVDCFLKKPREREADRKRYPKMAANWRKAVVANWEKWHAVPKRNGEPRAHARFKSGEEFYAWWISGKAHCKPDPFYEGCQSGLLYTNQPDDEENA